MQDNTIPADADGWNSDKVVTGDLSCEKLARILTAAVATARLAIDIQHTQGDLAVLKLVNTLVSTQLRLIESGVLKPEDRAAASANVCSSLIAMGLGLSAGLTSADPRALAELLHTALQAATDLAKKDQKEFASSHLDFCVKEIEASDGFKSKVAIGVRVIPVQEVSDAVDQVEPKIIKLGEQGNN